MLKVQCEACGAPYDVDPRRVPANGMKMRCPACGASVHVAPPGKAAPAELDFELDLPAAKAAGPGTNRAALGLGIPSLPPVKAAPRARLDADLDDLPALKQPAATLSARLSASAEGDLADLPQAKPASASQPLRANPESDPDSMGMRVKRDLADLPQAKPAPASQPLRAHPEADPASMAMRVKPAHGSAPLRGGHGTGRELAADLDLPATKHSGGAPQPSAPTEDPNLDLPAAKHGQRPGLPELDLPAAKQSPRFEPDGAVEAHVPPSRRSFAKPPNTARTSIPQRDQPEARASARGGTMPKDSLALDPKPFFASAPPIGMFGKLDEIGGDAPPKPSDLIDLPAPHDLPAVKRPPPKATALGLGQRLSRDSLDLPAEFGAPKVGTFATPDDDGGFAFDPPQQSDAMPARRGGDTAPSAAAARALATPALSELDLPAPRDLPAVKKRPPPAATALGLGTGLGGVRRDSLDVHLAHGAPEAGAPKSFELSLDLPPMTPRSSEHESSRSALAADEHDRAFDHMHSPGGGSFGTFTGELELDAGGFPRRDAESLGDLEPIVLPSAGTSNTNSLSTSTLELAPQDLMLTGADQGFSLSDTSERQRLVKTAARRSELGLELKGMNDLSSSPGERGGLGGSSFGELDLGLGRESHTGTHSLVPTEGRPGAPVALGLQAQAVDAELVPSDEELALRDERRRRAGRRLPGWLVPAALALGIGTSGVALGLFTDHGYFGVYLFEQLLPATGDPERVRAAITHAEQKARSDTYVDVRKSLVMLSDARNEAGLNRELLARSLLHEALYQLRFGEDAQSAQRSAAILARALERGEDDSELTLARAADAARRGELEEAKQLLASSSSTDDPYRALVAGELALLDGQPKAAATSFSEAAKSTGARGHFGLVRAHIAAGDVAAAEAAAKATLSASPLHTGAHVFLAERALAADDLPSAIEHVHIAAGRASVDGEKARPSRAERAQAFSLEGRIAERRDHPREAQAAYEQALTTDPLNVDMLLGSGRMLMRLGRPQDALSRFDSALGARPSDQPDAHGNVPLLQAGLGTIEALLALSRPKEALERSTALLAQFPNDTQVKLWQGHALAALERWEQAEAIYREVIEKAPKLFAGYVGLSQLLFKRNRPEEAARALSLATGRVEDGAEMRRMLGHSELTRNHLPEAIHQFEAALRFNPADAGALFGLVVAQRKSGAMDAAEQTLKRLETLDPSFPGLALERGQIYESRGAHEEAIQTYKKALEQRPTDSELKLHLGAALVVANQLDEAESALTQVLKERPNSAEAEHYLGRVLFARNETAQAAQRFERAVNNDILKAEYHLYLAWALLEQGNYGGALSSVRKAIERDPNLGDARWLLGRIQLHTGAVRDALVNFQAALRLKPSRTEALANMGDAYDELRDSAQAIKSYQEALKRAPEHGDWWYRLGQLQLDKGRRDEARVALSEAVLRGDKARDRPSWLADAHRLYGDVLRDSKRAPEASEHYRLFLELAPLGHPDRAEIEQLLYKTRDSR